MSPDLDWRFITERVTISCKTPEECETLRRQIIANKEAQLKELKDRLLAFLEEIAEEIKAERSPQP